MSIPLYSTVTPLTTLFDGTTDIDILSSQYANMRYSVAVDKVITIDAKYEANLPGLAFDYYADVEYWRAIMCFNGLVDPLNDVCVGAQIGLPNKSSLDAFFAAAGATANDTLTI
jgi:hypothetical protein